MIYLRYFTVSILTVLLASCATTSAVKKLDLNGEKVLVISGFTQEFNVNVIGTTIFTNHNDKFENLDLDTNQLIKRSFNSADKTKLFEIYEDPKTTVFNKGNWYTGMGFNLKYHLDDLKRIATSKNARYVLIIGSERNADSVFNTNQFFSNYGIARRSVMGNTATILYVSMKMALVDMQTEKIIKQVSDIGKEYTFEYDGQKIHDLERNDFLKLRNSYDQIFNNTISHLVYTLGF